MTDLQVHHHVPGFNGANQMPPQAHDQAPLSFVESRRRQLWKEPDKPPPFSPQHQEVPPGRGRGGYEAREEVQRPQHMRSDRGSQERLQPAGSMPGREQLPPRHLQLSASQCVVVMKAGPIGAGEIRPSFTACATCTTSMKRLSVVSIDNLVVVVFPFSDNIKQ